MGRGDKRSFKGKVFKGSYGKSRPRNNKKTTATPAGSSSASGSAQQQQRKR
jgi:30S ribosomal protein S31